MLTSQATLSDERLAALPEDGPRSRDLDGRRPARSDGGRSLGDGSPEPDQDVAGLLREVENLRRRLRTQPIIEQAKGVLVGFYGIHPDAAFAVLVRWSQHSNTKLHLLAERLVAAAGTSLGQPQAGLQDFLNQLAHSGVASATPGEWTP